MVFLVFIFMLLPFSVLDYSKQTFSVYFLRKYIFLICVFYFILVAGGRNYPGTGDWENYRGTFEASGKIGDIRLLGYYELGFELLINIIKTISNKYTFFFLAYEIIACIFLYYNIKKYIGYPLTACCLYFPIMFLVLDLILIRTLLAVQIFIFSIQYIKDRKFIPFFLCILCASMIHISSIILFPLYFILYKRLKNITVILIITFGILINLFRIDIFRPLLRLISPIIGGSIESRTMFYLSSNLNYRRSIGFIHLEYLVFFPLFMRYRKKIEGYDKYSNIFFNMYILYGMTIFYLWSLSVFSGRIKFFFISSLIFLVPRLIRANKKMFILVFFCYFGYVLAMAIYVMFFQGVFGGSSSGFYMGYSNSFF